MSLLKPIFQTLILAVVLCLASCTSVKQYQKAFLNDAEMNLENRKSEIFEADFQSYREGSVGGTNGNSGSGCGCN